MPKKVYLKDQSFDPIYKSVNVGFYFKSRILSGLLMALGFLILGSQVILPLIFFETQDTISEPVRKSALGLVAGFNDFSFSELKKNNGANTSAANNVPEVFYLSIPKLKITNALVETNSTNLSPEKSLGHYKGSNLPGEAGTSFIYGHSVLPMFFNPKNYKTIFSTLDNLVAGDEILITYNNNTYTYTVETKVVFAPEKVNPVAQYKPAYLNESSITLMTCYPVGTKAKRLLVNAVRK
jgi:LPXTG-site transpeptidase (sortase) family protein